MSGQAREEGHSKCLDEFTVKAWGEGPGLRLSQEAARLVSGEGMFPKGQMHKLRAGREQGPDRMALFVPAVSSDYISEAQ